MKAPASAFYKFIFAFLLIYFARPALLAQEAKYDGYLELGGDIDYNDLYTESFYKAKLEFKLKLNDRTKVEIDIRGKSEEEEIKFGEASVDYDINDGIRITLGALKKRFGTEELSGREKLNTVRRSMVNTYLSPLGYISRDAGIHIRLKNKHRKIITGINYNETHNLTFMLRYDRKDIWLFNKIGGGLHYVRHLSTQGINYSYALSMNFMRKFNSLESGVEFFYGVDPLKTAYRRISGNKENVEFTAVRLETLYKFTFNNTILRGIEPVVQLGFLSPDTKSLDVNKIDLLIGMNVYIDENIRFMINGDLVLSNNTIEKRDRSMNGSYAIAQFQISW